MTDFLEKVRREKTIEIERSRQRISESDLERMIGGYRARSSFKAAFADRRGIIAEIKRASPSAGMINKEADVSRTAKIYEDAGALAVSVLTDKKHFAGSLADLKAARAACELPILRKDFIIEKYQMLEAAACGADAVLLITALLGKRLQESMAEASSLGLEALVEVNREDEFRQAIDAGAEIIGINNRNLRTLEVDLDVTRRLAGLKPKGVILVAASGVSSMEDAVEMFDYGADALLVGSFLMRSNDPAKALRSLVKVAS